MDSIWHKLYDGAKDRRYGMLFFVTVAGLIGLFVLDGVVSGIADADRLLEFILTVLSGFGTFIAVVGLRMIRRKRERGEERIEYRELSRDELAKARSKLMKGKLKL